MVDGSWVDMNAHAWLSTLEYDGWTLTHEHTHAHTHAHTQTRTHARPPYHILTNIHDPIHRHALRLWAIVLHIANKQTVTHVCIYLSVGVCVCVSMCLYVSVCLPI